MAHNSKEGRRSKAGTTSGIAGGAGGHLGGCKASTVSASVGDGGGAAGEGRRHTNHHSVSGGSPGVRWESKQQIFLKKLSEAPGSMGNRQVAVGRCFPFCPPSPPLPLPLDSSLTPNRQFAHHHLSLPPPHPHAMPEAMCHPHLPAMPSMTPQLQKLHWHCRSLAHSARPLAMPEAALAFLLLSSFR